MIDVMTGPLARTHTEHELPLERLSPRDFERLGLGLAIAEGYEKSAHLGAAGGDGGIDILTAKDGRTVAFQCKREHPFGPGDAVAAVDEVLKLPVAQRPAEILLLVASDVSKKAREKGAAQAGTMAFEVWARTELEQRLRRHPPLLEQFFGLPAARLPERVRPAVTGPPKLPRHFQERTAELARVEEALRAESSARLAIAGRSAVGVEGMGGVGKSVLAAAAAQDLGAEFPAGVFWVPVGRDADCLALLRALADALGVPSADFVSIPQARDRLRRRLAGERALVVLDDVWTLQDAEALDVVDFPGRQLLTSRNASLLAASAAEVVRIDVLEPPAALALLAAWSGRDLADLPSAAREVAEECGRLPLALALAGALARKVGRWEDVLDHLRRADLGRLAASLPNYPYPDLLRALAASVEALEPRSRERYLELAVFPEDAAIPEAAVAILWSPAGLDAAQARELVGELADFSLLRWDAGGRVTLHDLQRDYLRHLTGDLRALHERMVEAYRVRYPEGFATGQNDGWLLQRLAWHLHEAEREAELRALLFSFPWLQARLTQGDGNGALNDLDFLSGEPAARKLQDALRQGLHILLADPAQLAGQLLGRLGSGEDPSLDRLLSEAEGWRGAPWLRPLHPLAPAPHALHRTLVTGDNLKALAALDERCIVTASDAGLELWDLETGARLQSQHEKAESLAVVDHRTVAYRDADGTVGLWDVTADVLSPLVVRSARGLRSLRAALSPLGIVLGTFRIAAHLVARRWYRYHFRRGGEALAALGDGRLAVARPDASIQVVCTRSGRALSVLPGLLTPTASLQKLDEGYLASASRDGKLGVWDLGTGRLVRTHNLPMNSPASGPPSLAALPGSPLLAATNMAGSLLVWNWRSGEALREDAKSDYIRALAWLDEHRLATLSQRATLRIWDAEKRETVFQLPQAQLGYPEVLERAGPRFLLSAGRNGNVRIWDLGKLLERCNPELDRPERKGMVAEAGRPSDAPPHDETPVFTPYRGVIHIALLDQRKAAAMTYDGTLQIWDIDKATILRTFLPGLGDVPSLCAIGPDRLAVFNDQTLQLWSLDGHHDDHVVEVEHAYCLVSLANGQMAVTGSGSLYVLSPRGVLCETYPSCAALDSFWQSVDEMKAAGNRIVFTVSGQPNLYFQDVGGADGEVPLGSYPGTLAPLQGRWVVAVDREEMAGEGGLAVVDLDSRAVIRCWRCPVDIYRLTSVGLGRVASLSTDHTLRVWDAEEGRLLATFAFDVYPSALAASPDGRRIIVGDGEGHLHVFTFVESPEPTG